MHRKMWRQCAWCKKMMTGPMTGEYKKLTFGDSHGICQGCKNRMLASYRIRRQKLGLPYR